MGAVWRVTDEELGREVAMKVVRAPGLTDDDAARLLAEARVHARLEHPGIVPIHDVGRLADGRVYYVMKLVRGDRLDRHLRPDASLAERLRIFQRVCETIAFAHAHAVVHRDLKPGNIMVGSFGEVLLMDWGVAKVLGAGTATPSPASQPSRARVPAVHETADGTRLGTPGWMAPEQAAGDIAAIGPRTDVYGLGAILFFLLAGSAPGEGAASVVADLRRVRPGLPRPLQAICARALSSRPDDRYPNAEALSEEIDRFQAGLPVIAYPEGLFERAMRLATRYRTPILLILSYLLMRVLLIAFAGR
jgi:serine/threonine-protein kinase